MRTANYWVISEATIVLCQVRDRRRSRHGDGRDMAIISDVATTFAWLPIYVSSKQDMGARTDWERLCLALRLGTPDEEGPL